MIVRSMVYIDAASMIPLLLIQHSQIIALNTFWILFLRWKLKRYVLVAAMFGGWSVVGAIVSTGPASLQQVSTGPFCESSVIPTIMFSEHGRRCYFWILVLGLESIS